MYIDYFDKFKGMTPYLHINSEEWAYIKTTFEREDVKDSLAQICMEYDLPYAEITETEARKEYLALKGTRYNELLKRVSGFLVKHRRATIL